MGTGEMGWLAAYVDWSDRLAQRLGRTLRRHICPHGTLRIVFGLLLLINTVLFASCFLPFRMVNHIYMDADDGHGGKQSITFWNAAYVYADTGSRLGILNFAEPMTAFDETSERKGGPKLTPPMTWQAFVWLRIPILLLVANSFLLVLLVLNKGDGMKRVGNL